MFFFIYKLDPRAKILMVSLLTVLVFVVDKFSIAVVLALLFLIIRLAGKIPFSGGRSFAILAMLAVFVILTQILFGPGENYIIKPLFPPSFPLLGGLGSLKWDGLLRGVTISCRLAALMILLPMLTATTSVERIATGLCAMGVNYRAAFVITTAFNLIPLFKEEGRAIVDAQKLRGVHSIKAYPSLAVPLVLGAMRKAQSVSVAMDSRAFGAYNTRTWLDKPEMKTCDFVSIAVCVFFSAAMLFFNFC